MTCRPFFMGRKNTPLKRAYPPYDIVRKGEDAFQSFSSDDISITSEASQLTVTGKKPEKDTTEYLYQGIQPAPSNGVSISPITLKWRAPHLKTGFSILI